MMTCLNNEYTIYRVKPEHWHKWGVAADMEATLYLWEIREICAEIHADLDEFLKDCEVVLRR